MKSWKRWRRRTIGLWTLVLVLIGTKAPVIRDEALWKHTVEPEPVRKEIPAPVLLAEALGPEFSHGEKTAQFPAGEEAIEGEPSEAEPPEAEPPEDEPAEDEPPEDEPSERTESETAESPEDESAELLSQSTEPESPEEEADETAESPKQNETDNVTPDPLKTLGDNPEKRLLLFGDENWGRHQVYESEELAATFMETVEVPVWTQWKGVKSQGTMRLTVNRALAQDVVEIFTEIYNDPEQFPIESMGGFRYRTGTQGEHNNGSAIDINADQNFQVRDGVAMTGSCWEPGVNPYSMPEDGSVVRIFKAHGWSWGGDAWEENADASTGYHDYMHFSYRGM